MTDEQQNTQNEKKETQGQEPTEIQRENEDGDSQKETSSAGGLPNNSTPLLDETKKAVRELREQNDRKEALLKKEEQLQSERLLAGRSLAVNAGVMTEQDKKKAKAKAFWKGTEIEKSIERNG